MIENMYKNILFTTLPAPVIIKVRVSTQSGLFEISSMDEEIVCTGRVSQLHTNSGPPDVDRVTHSEVKKSHSQNNNSMVTDLKTLDKEGFYRVHAPPGHARRGSYRNVAGANLNCKICFLNLLM